MGSPLEGNQGLHSVYDDDFYLFTDPAPHIGTGVRNTGQVNSGYADILICDLLQPWPSVPDNPYPGGHQFFDEVGFLTLFSLLITSNCS